MTISRKQQMEPIHYTMEHHIHVRWFDNLSLLSYLHVVTYEHCPEG